MVGKKQVKKWAKTIRMMAECQKSGSKYVFTDPLLGWNDGPGKNKHSSVTIADVLDLIASDMEAEVK
jgi:hypothetical protein